MRIFRTFLVLLSAAALTMGGSACGGDGSDEPEASTTTGVFPQEVPESDEGEPGGDQNVPGDGEAPASNPGGTGN